MRKKQAMAGKAAKPVFGKTPKKPEADDLPGKMRRGKSIKKLAGMKI